MRIKDSKIQVQIKYLALLIKKQKLSQN